MKKHGLKFIIIHPRNVSIQICITLSAYLYIVNNRSKLLTFSTHLFTYRFTELKAVNLNIVQFLNGKTVWWYPVLQICFFACNRI